MKKRIALGMTAVLCVTALVISSASAAGAFQPEFGANGGDRLTALLDSLGDQGYDVADILSAIENGDHETARRLMQQFMEQNGDALPDRPPCDADRGDRLTGLLYRLEDQGYDVADILSAIENGNHENARSLMQQFMKQYGDDIPSPPCGEGRGKHREECIPSQEA